MLVNAIVAVGKQGQIGLEGNLPWRHDNTLAIPDLAWFREQTAEGLLICGYNTYVGLPKLKQGRVILLDDIKQTPEEFLASFKSDKPIWIIGGAKTYERYAHLIDRWYIGKINYEGAADTFFDFSLLIK